MKKLNNGFMTVITIEDYRFEIDGYVKKEIIETLCKNKTVVTLNWTDHCKETELVLSEANDFENKNGEFISVEIEDIDPFEKRKFNSMLELADQLDTFVASC